jgi:prepilin-type processing-associated H-X9-DG protein
MIYTLSQIKHAERTFVFIETNDYWNASPDALISPCGAALPPPIYPKGLQEGGFVQVRPAAFHRSGSAPEGCTISFADGHAIFWQFAVPNISTEWVSNVGPDVWQLAAWGDGPLPPGVTP